MSLTVEKCLQGWTNSFRQMNAKADIVFFGDSLTYYGDFASVFPGKVVCNLGLRGDTIQGMIDRVDQLELLEPKIVFVMAGVNDVLLPLDEFKRQYRILADAIINVKSAPTLFIHSILPVNSAAFSISCNNEQIRRCNCCIKEIAVNEQCHYIDLFAEYYDEYTGQLSKGLTRDGIHLIDSAYDKWYNKAAMAVNEII